VVVRQESFQRTNETLIAAGPPASSGWLSADQALAKTAERIGEIGGSKTIETQRNGGSGGMTRIFEERKPRNQVKQLGGINPLLHPAIGWQGESR